MLPIEGNDKIVGIFFLRDKGKIGDQAAADGFAGSVENASGQMQVFLGRDHQQIVNNGVTAIGNGGIVGEIKEMFCL